MYFSSFLKLYTSVADLSQTAGIPFRSVSQPRRTTAVQICTRNKLTLFTAEDAPCIAVAAVGDAVRGRRVVERGGEGGCKRQQAQNEEADPGPKRLSRSTNHRPAVFGDRPSVPHHTPAPPSPPPAQADLRDLQRADGEKQRCVTMKVPGDPADLAALLSLELKRGQK